MKRKHIPVSDEDFEVMSEFMKEDTSTDNDNDYKTEHKG
jgi:hypothetical protein